MKLSRKFVMVSAAALMAVAPVVPVITNGVFPVAAASKKSSKKPTITVKKNSYFYDKKGKRVKKFIGVTYLAKGQWAYVVSTKTVTIKGTEYYQLAKGVYVKAANVSKVNGKAVKKSSKVSSKTSSKTSSSSTSATSKSSSSKTSSSTSAASDSSSSKTSSSTSATSKSSSSKTSSSKTTAKKNTITLGKNAYFYDKKGKRVNKFLDVTYLKKGQWAYVVSTKTVTIKGTKYYQLASNVFVKAVNVSKVNGKAVKSSTKKTTKKSTKKTTSKKTAKKSTKKTTSKKTAKKSTKKTTSKKTAKKSTKKSTKLSKTVVTTSKKVYVYDAKGKRVKSYEGLAYIGKNVKLKNLGVKTIKGVKYMALTPNKYYIKVSDVKNA